MFKICIIYHVYISDRSISPRKNILIISKDSRGSNFLEVSRCYRDTHLFQTIFPQTTTTTTTTTVKFSTHHWQQRTYFMRLSRTKRREYTKPVSSTRIYVTRGWQYRAKENMSWYGVVAPASSKKEEKSDVIGKCNLSSQVLFLAFLVYVTRLNPSPTMIHAEKRIWGTRRQSQVLMK